MIMTKENKDSISIRLDIEGKEYQEFKFLQDYYGINTAKDLVTFMLAREFRELQEKSIDELIKQRDELLEKEKKYREKFGPLL